MAGIFRQTICAIKGHKWQHKDQIFKRIKQNSKVTFVLHDRDVCTKCNVTQLKPIELGVK